VKVKAGKGLSFWVNRQRVDEETVVSVQLNHDIRCKLADGSLIEVKENKKESVK
jgi:hypothetical protein